MRVLLLNDDGANSPLLRPFVSELCKEGWCNELHVVVPSQERSWIGSAITRWQSLEVSALEGVGTAAMSVSGTPADCALLGVFNLFPTPPDLVISGINMGENSGVAYFMSSGTIGAAATAASSGVPAVALSVGMTPETRAMWITQDYEALAGSASEWERIAAEATRVLRRIVESGALEHCRLFSVNMPFEVNASTLCRIARISRTRFSRIFRRREDGLFEHHMEPCTQESCEQGECTDWDIVRSGAVAIHPVEFNMSATLPDALLEKLSPHQG